MPLASVSVSSTKPAATSRNRKRSSVSSGGVPRSRPHRAARGAGAFRGRSSRSACSARRRTARRRPARPRCGPRPAARRRRSKRCGCTPTSGGSSAQTAATGRTTAPTPGSARSTPDNHATSTASARDQRQRIDERQVEAFGRDDAIASVDRERSAATSARCDAGPRVALVMRRRRRRRAASAPMRQRVQRGDERRAVESTCTDASLTRARRRCRRARRVHGRFRCSTTLTERLSRVVKTLRGEARLTDANIQDALREVRLALLEADVALPVVRSFIARCARRRRSARKSSAR